MKTKSKLRPAGRILYVPLELLRPFPLQSRTLSDPDRDAALRDSVAKLGILEPLTVCYDKADVYLVISGERRRKAAVALGLAEIPCILVDGDPLTCTVNCLTGNLQLRELHYLEKAAYLERIVSEFEISVRTLAERAGIPVPELTALTRYLAIPQRLRTILAERQLPEPFAALLLHHADDAEKQKLLEEIVENGLTLAEAQARSAEILKGSPPPGQKLKTFFRDATVFLNTIDHAVETMQAAGIAARCTRTDGEGEIEYRIVIPK